MEDKETLLTEVVETVEETTAENAPVEASEASSEVTAEVTAVEVATVEPIELVEAVEVVAVEAAPAEAIESQEVVVAANDEVVAPEPLVRRTVGFFGESSLHALCVDLVEKLPEAWEVVLVSAEKKTKNKKKALNSDIVFISGEFCSDVEKLVASIREARQDSVVVIRGDVPIGTTARLEAAFGNVMYNPDNTSPIMTDEEKRSQLVSEGYQLIGLIEADTEKLKYVIDLFTALNFNNLWASKNVAFVGSTVAELTRATTITFLAMKGQFLKELSALATGFDVDGELLKNIVSANASIGSTEIDLEAYKPTLHAIFQTLETAAKEKELDLKLHAAVHKTSKCED